MAAGHGRDRFFGERISRIDPAIGCPKLFKKNDVAALVNFGRNDLRDFDPAGLQLGESEWFFASYWAGFADLVFRFSRKKAPGQPKFFVGNRLDDPRKPLFFPKNQPTYLV